MKIKDNLLDADLPTNTQVDPKSDTKTSRNKRKTILIAIGAILLLLVGFRIYDTYFNPPPQEETVINVKTAAVHYDSISVAAPVTGRIEPVEEVSIVPMASGEVTAVRVRIGDQVTKGTVLFEIDKTQISASYNQASAAYAMSKKTYDNMALLYNEGAVSMNDMDQAKVQYEAALSAYTTASEAYSNTSVKSPINGYVTSLTVSVGSMASPGVPAASIADVSSLVINTTLSEYLVGQLKTGDPVEILISTLKGKTFKGIVTALSPAPAKGTLTYPVEFSVDDKTNTVKAGMFAEIRITADQREKVLVIPSDAVIVKEGKSIVVVIKNNLPIYREIEIGLDNGTSVEVVKGLKENETIAIEGQQYATEGIEVNVIK